MDHFHDARVIEYRAAMTQVVPSHAPQGTAVLAVVQAHFEAWLVFRRNDGRPIPKYVERAFWRYLECGDPAAGYTVFGCDEDDYSRSFARCCRGRGFCCFCLTYRQRERGRHLMESVIGAIPVRQWVECFPPALRYVLCYDNRLLRAGFAALAQAVFEFQVGQAVELWEVGDDAIHPAGVLVHHRASATLEANHHFHGIFVDGVFVEVGGQVEFRQLPGPTDEQVAGVAFEACLKFCEALSGLGFWVTTGRSSGTIEGILSLPNGAPCRAKFFGQAARDADGGVAPQEGAYAFHVYVGPSVRADGGPQLERLVHYILAPPFRDEQVTVNREGKVQLRLKRPRHDGTTLVTLTPYEFLDRLADLVPRPNLNTVRYFGAYAPRTPVRKRVVAVAMTRPSPARGKDEPDRCQDAAAVTGSLECPLCRRILRFIRTVRPRGRRRRDHRGVPPDIPTGPNPRVQDRVEQMAFTAVQGRLWN